MASARPDATRDAAVRKGPAGVRPCCDAHAATASGAIALSHRNRSAIVDAHSSLPSDQRRRRDGCGSASWVVIRATSGADGFSTALRQTRHTARAMARQRGCKNGSPLALHPLSTSETSSTGSVPQSGASPRSTGALAIAPVRHDDLALRYLSRRDRRLLLAGVAPFCPVRSSASGFVSVCDRLAPGRVVVACLWRATSPVSASLPKAGSDDGEDAVVVAAAAVVDRGAIKDTIDGGHDRIRETVFVLSLLRALFFFWCLCFGPFLFFFLRAAASALGLSLSWQARVPFFWGERRAQTACPLLFSPQHPHVARRQVVCAHRTAEKSLPRQDKLQEREKERGTTAFLTRIQCTASCVRFILAKGKQRKCVGRRSSFFFVGSDRLWARKGDV